MLQIHRYVSFSSFILTLALVIVNPLEHWSGNSTNAFQTGSTAFAQTLLKSKPAAPTGLVATAASSSAITVTWADQATNENGFKIQRARGGGTFRQVATVGANITTYADSGLKAATSYSYRVRAYNSAGRSAFSNTASATTTDPTTTPPPTTTSTTTPPPTTTSTTTPPPTTTSTTTTSTTTPGPVFYVSPTGSDSNPGTQAAPWRTIQHAASTLQAGDTGVVLDGTYEEPEIAFRRSGTATQPITLKAQNQWGAILSSTSSCHPAISLYASYITIEDLWLRVSPNDVLCTTGTTANYSIHAWEGTNPHPTSPSSGYAGLIVRGVKIDGSTHRYGALKTQQDYSLVENSIADAGLEAFNSTNVIFRNNVVSGGGGIVVKGGSRNTQVYNNVLHFTGSSAYGILLGGATCVGCSWDNAYEVYNGVAYNNVAINDSGSGAGLYGMRGCSNCTISNNVGIAGQFYMQYGGVSGLNNLNPRWENNILTCNNGAATGNWGNYWSGTLTVDHNDFYQCTGVPAQTHPVTGDPLFVNIASDWHVQPGSPALGSGVEVFMFGFNGELIDVSRNKDGNFRTAPWNLGIY